MRGRTPAMLSGPMSEDGEARGCVAEVVPKGGACMRGRGVHRAAISRYKVRNPGE